MGFDAVSRQLAEDRWLAGLDAHAGEVEARAGAGQSRLDQIEFAGGDAAGDDQQIGSAALCERGVESFGGVGAVGRTHGSPPAAATIAASMGALELRIWPGAGEDRTGTSSSPVARMATRGRTKT